MLDDLVWITKIKDANGNELYKWDRKDRSKRVMSESSAFLVHTMLGDALKEGSGERGYDASVLGDFKGGGKTGTTFDFSNNWFVGYNGRVTCGVWTGFYSGSKKEIYPEAFSVDTVMPVWMDTMKLAGRELASKEIEVPSEVVSVKICKHSGMIATKNCEEFEHDVVTGEKRYVSTSYDEYFKRSEKPKGTCSVHGASLGGFHDDLDLGDSMSIVERMNTVPIKPKKPTLVGEDPYKAAESVYAKKQTTFNAIGRGLSSMDFNLTKEVEDQVMIPLLNPDRVEITD